MDRVFIRNGSGNIIIIAPHGHPLDDTNSDILAQSIASQINCDAVVNTGWRRDKIANTETGIANCNDFRHCSLPAVSAEFLGPIQIIINKKLREFNSVFIFLMHGMGDAIRDKIPNIDAIVGYGNGKPPKFTCDLNHKDSFIQKMNQYGIVTRESVMGGKFCAYNDFNLAQALRKSISNVQCLQVEIIGQRRKDTNTSIETGRKIGTVIREMFNH